MAQQQPTKVAQAQHGLDGDEQCRHIEGLEQDLGNRLTSEERGLISRNESAHLGSLLTVATRVERSLGKQDGVLLGIGL